MKVRSQTTIEGIIDGGLAADGLRSSAELTLPRLAPADPDAGVRRARRSSDPRKTVLEVGATAPSEGLSQITAGAIAYLKASGRGRVINIASLASFVGFLDVAPYNVSKGGVRSLTQTLAIEWAKDKIAVNALAPGVFPTDINASLLEGTDRGRELITRTPMKRFGKVEELGGAAVFLASDAASYVTGEVIVVDGGFLASGVNQ